MGDFTKLSKAVTKQFDKMSEGKLFKVDVDSDLLWETYLGAFPDGTNEIYRERTEHDCSCCRGFIKNIGSVISIENDKIVTVWDIKCDEYPYDIVAKTMAEFVYQHSIRDQYFTKENKYGNEFNLELLDDKTTRKWDHFVGIIKPAHHSDTPAEAIGIARTEFQVFKRSLEELSYNAIETVVDLIESKAIYRGQEHLGLVKAFKEQKQAYDAYTGNDKDLFIWQNIGKGSVTRFRNTVIGTLVTDISGGVGLEDAVKMFEFKVAPTNYKRPKALITPKMIEQAMETIRELGLEPALERRHAKFSDVSVNDVLFVDNAVKSQMIGGLEEELLKTVKSKAVKVKNVVEVSIDDFISTVVPKAEEIEVLVKNKNLPNLVSLTAPVNADVGQLFKWNNNFAWSYDGNVADSDIKTRVKAAGGNVEALFRVSLGWFNFDDLDIHVRTPSGDHVSYSNKAGILDIDMNAGGKSSREAVENTCWNERNLEDGKYVFSVNNYKKRESIDVGFTLELDFAGAVETFHYPKTVGNRETIQCLEVTIRDKSLVSVKKLNTDLTSETASQDKWGIETETFTAVSSIVLSPNHWEGNSAGNKHWFFLLKGCKNPDPIRGIYNEFLNPDLDKHRKVFEIIGDKIKCQSSDEQMSGIGFSSTKKDELTIKVKSNKTQQIYNIKF